MRNISPKQAGYLFFLRHAGFSYDPKTETKQQGRSRCARQLAKAERDAAALGYWFDWMEDYDYYENSLGDHGYWCEDARNGVEHSHEVYCCIAHDDSGNTKASLGAIIDPTREYRRVIEAELALEAL